MNSLPKFMMASLMLAFVLGALMSAPAIANANVNVEPILEIEFGTNETIPGQPLPLRLTVLVPTWMPKPVAFPSFEIPNIRTRLPGRSTFPTSRRVGAETWSGVVRTYYLTPLVPGAFTIPPQSLEVTYAEPGGIEPVTASLKTDALLIRGVVPQGAESLRPFIAATSLTLDQEISETTTDLAPGDSVQRLLTARVEGTSPFSLPQLLPDHILPGMRAYPDRAVVEEREDGSALSGTRVEKITLMAEGGGTGEAPEVTVRWYNLETEVIETSKAPGFAVSIIAPPPPPVPPDHGKMIRLALMLLIGSALAYWLGRRISPAVRAAFKRRRQIRRATESWAFEQLRKQVKARNYAGTLAALEAWAGRLPPVNPVNPGNNPDVAAALNQIGEARYSAAPSQAQSLTRLPAWKKLDRALEKPAQANQKSRRSSQEAGAAQP